MNPDGSMSAQEYLEAASKIEAEMSELRRRQAALDLERMHSRQRETPVLENYTTLRDAMQHAFQGRTGTYTCDNGSSKFKQESHPYVLKGADLVIDNVHNLGTRAVVGKQAHPGLQSASDPMREQMDEGTYPTMEQHAAGTSPAYEPIPLSVGYLQYKKLTKEEEDAIKYRKRSDSV